MGVVRTGHCTAAIVIAASGVSQYGFFGMRLGRIGAMMRAGAAAAGMGGRSACLHRHRKQRSEKGDQQQKSGCPALHDIP
jgi:hypothetical protein